MDPLSISASIAGLIALTTGLIKLTDTLRSSFKEDVLQLVVSVSQDIELLHGVLLRVQTWADSVQSNEKFHSQLLNLSPFVSNCTDVIKRIGGELLALKEVAKKRGFKRLYSTVSLNEKMKALDASRLSLGEAKTTLLLALSAKTQDISTSLDSIQTKLETIYENLSSSTPKDTKLNTTEFDGPKSFEEWLQTFTGEVKAGELSDYRRKKKLQAERQREVPSEETPHDSTKIYVKIVDMKNKDGRTVTETLLLDKRANIIDVIHQLHDRGYEDVCGFQTEDGAHRYGPFEDIESPPLVRSTRGPSSYDIRGGLKVNEHERLIDYFNKFLDYQSPKDAEGHPSRIAVRRKELSDGFEITDLHDHDSSKVDIRFSQSLRLPGDEQIYRPPRSFGTFPLLSVSDFESKLPPRMVEKGGFFFPMLQREGLKITFEPSVRMAGPDEAFAIRLYVGSVNAVSGALASDPVKRGQDYIVAPKQSELDGVRTKEDHVKQFVAMPLSWGYSLEKQVTGSETIGGIQLEIAPKLKTAVNFLKKRHSQIHNEPTWHVYSSLQMGFNLCHETKCHDFVLDKFKSPHELGISECFMDPWLDSGFRVKCDDTIHDGIQARLKARKDEFGITSGYSKLGLRSRFVHELGSHLQQGLGGTSKSPLVFHPIMPLQFRIEHDTDATLAGTGPNSGTTHRFSRFSPFTDFRDFLAAILEKYILPENSWTTNSVTINDKELSCFLEICKSRQHKPIFDLIPSGATVSIGPCDIDSDNRSRSNLTSKLKSLLKRERGYHTGHFRSKRYRTQGSTRYGLAGWEMGIGVQGNIIQNILKTKTSDLWRWERSRFINIQIINAVVFQKITGLSYNSPIPLRAPKPDPVAPNLLGYSEGGYQGGAASPNGGSGDTNLISTAPSAVTPPYQTITEIDKEEMITFNINLVEGKYKIGCACCERNFCDTM
ncbi:hypothetical protein TWF730_002888 [Orbilia blumenaviensis]|uniref:Fungal N-terminal domain-containing protein n=1 Tax=Orbilia blumenaviensis TaxID=1796055 RepID=A0AAV9U9P0_9PEZI